MTLSVVRTHGWAVYGWPGVAAGPSAGSEPPAWPGGAGLLSGVPAGGAGTAVASGVPGGWPGVPPSDGPCGPGPVPGGVPCGPGPSSDGVPCGPGGVAVSTCSVARWPGVGVTPPGPCGVACGTGVFVEAGVAGGAAVLRPGMSVVSAPGPHRRMGVAPPLVPGAGVVAAGSGVTVGWRGVSVAPPLGVDRPAGGCVGPVTGSFLRGSCGPCCPAGPLAPAAS